MRRNHACLTIIAAAALAFANAGAHAGNLPERPENIEFRPLDFQPPNAADHRHETRSGVPVYLAPSREFPLVQINFSFRGGAYLEPADKAGLASMTGAMIRRGGTVSVSADELDERFDFLAANVSTGSGDVMSSASLNTLTWNLDESLELFIDMLRRPGFEQEKVRIYRNESIERMRQRNDNPGPILGREWSGLVNGWDHYSSRVPTRNSLESITTDDMRAFHAKVFQPGNLIITVTGDFEVDDMLARIEHALEGWAHGERMPEPPAPTATLTPGVYHVEMDIPQGSVAIGMRGVDRDHPDYFPLLVMNDILGGGGFTSRITNRVRSDEGLAYGAGSSMSMPAYFPGVFRAGFQSKNSTVALAIKIVKEEIEKIRNQPVTEEERTTSINSFIETFPRSFESRQGVVSIFASDEWTGRDPDYWQTYRENIRAVTVEDIQRVAREHLRPEEMAILVVGKWEEIAPGDHTGRASMQDFFAGQRNRIPLRDPLTMQPIAE
ncbi:MAG: insulinase family protein [Phycisphaerales bacterium]|nr:MAG: insulinase family protein [Phycisphaerales bacterium]